MTPTLDIYSAAVDLYNDDRLGEALVVAEAGLAADPDDGRLWELKGLVHRAGGDCDRARHALETATTFVPLMPVARCALADCYAHAGPEQLADHLYRDLLEDAATPSELLLPIAAGLSRLGESRLALQVCREAAHRDPDCPRAWHELTGHLGRCGFPMRLVLAAARKAVALAPEDGRYRVTLVSLLHRAGRLGEASSVAVRLATEQITEVGCRDCLARLAAVCLAAGERSLTAACRARIAALDAASAGEERRSAR